MLLSDCYTSKIKIIQINRPNHPTCLHLIPYLKLNEKQNTEVLFIMVCLRTITTRKGNNKF